MEQPDIYVTIHNPRIGKVREWIAEDGKRYFTFNLGDKISIFVDDIKEFMADLEKAIRDREVVKVIREVKEVVIK